jgi:hypothetical protein
MTEICSESWMPLIIGFEHPTGKMSQPGDTPESGYTIASSVTRDTWNRKPHFTIKILGENTR